MGIRESIKNLGKGISSLVSKKEQVYKPETLGEMLKNASNECKNSFYNTFYWLKPDYRPAASTGETIYDITIFKSDEEYLEELNLTGISIVDKAIEQHPMITRIKKSDKPKPAKVVKKPVVKKSAVKKPNKKK